MMLRDYASLCKFVQHFNYTLLQHIFYCTCAAGATYLGGVWCGFGWSKYSDHCYKYSSDETKLWEARAQCQGLGADLVSISDQAEMDFVQGIMYVYWLLR